MGGIYAKKQGIHNPIVSEIDDLTKKVVHNSSTWPSGLLQVAWVQRFEVFRDEHAVLANQFVVEPHLAPTVLGSLDQHHVPVDGGPVTVVALLVRLARREVQRAGDLFVEQNVAHRFFDVWIEAK